jgi:hypothetical protein
MGGSACFRLAALACVFMLAPALQAGGIPAKTLKEIKSASVYIKMEFAPAGGKGKAMPATGSGFLIHAGPHAAYIATNSHVVTPPNGQMAVGVPKVVFQSGTPQEQVVDATIVARDIVRDLAILKLTGVKNLPRPIPMDPALEVAETMPVYAIGFPFGAALSVTKKNNPAVTITKGSVSSIRQDDRGQVYLIQIDAEINPGNSGGPVLDEKGQLVGVSVSKIINSRTVGFAIPLKPLVDMLNGKVALVALDTLWVVKDQAEVSIEAGLVDPLGKLKDVALHYRVAKDIKDLPRPDEMGNVEPLKGTNAVWLKQSRGRAFGRLSLKGPMAGKVDVAYQASYVNAAGTTVYSLVNIATVDFTQVVYNDRLVPEDAPPNGKPQRIYTQPMKAGKHYVIEMRADPRELDPKVIVLDAAGEKLAEDDGAGGLYDAMLLFSPPKDDDYQIVATSVKGLGSIVLRIREETGRELGDKGLKMTGKLEPGDTFDALTPTPHFSTNVLFKKGKSYLIHATSKEFDPMLRLENMAKLIVKGEDVGDNSSSKLFFRPLQDGYYRILTTAFDGKTGSFDLSVTETPPLKELDVGDKELKIAGMLQPTDVIDVINGRASNFRCQIYAVKMKVGQKVQIDLVSNQFDAFLRVESQAGRELAADDDSGGNLNARLVFTPPADGVYRVIATHFDGRFGRFELTMKLVP